MALGAGVLLRQSPVSGIPMPGANKRELTEDAVC
jgi:hypothetical protein